MEITTDGEYFIPLCSHMGGVNDDHEIPSRGGWSYLTLDLTRYVGNDNVQIRFRFQSDNSTTQPGSYIDDVTVYGREMSPTSVTDQKQLPHKRNLIFNYPDPFNFLTTFNYTIQTPGQVNIEVFNISGQKVTVLFKGYQPAGDYSIRWNAKDDDGSELPSGIYFCKLKTKETTEVERAVLIK
jgi:hypothetical protein